MAAHTVGDGGGDGGGGDGDGCVRDDDLDCKLTS